MADAKILNRQKLKARLARIPKAVQLAGFRQLIVEVNGLVDAIKRAAPVDEAADNPGHLRDSVHAYRTPGRPLSYRIIADAKDETGGFIGQHVEQGHRTAEGKHVPAEPFFFPTYRARRRGMKRRMSAAARKAVKQIFPG